MKTALHIRRTILVPIRSAEGFLDLYFHDGILGGVRVPLSARLALGDSCELEFAFAAEQMVFHSRGVARWRRTRAQKNLPAGIGVEFEAGQRHTRDLLLDFANGKKVSLIQRQSRRFPAELQVDYKSDQVFATDVTDNISAGGCFIKTNATFALGDIIQLKLRPPGFLLGISVKGEVVWQQRGAIKGVGVRFVQMNRSTRKKIDELLERIKRRATELEGSPEI